MQHDQFLRRFNDLHSAIEKNQFIKPSIKIFMKASSCFQFEIGILHTTFRDIAMPYILFDSFPDNVSPLPQDQNELRTLIITLENLIRVIQEHSSTITYDFRVEIQNLLVGTIFNNKVPLRNPLDQNVLVITTQVDKLGELNDHFDNNSFREFFLNDDIFPIFDQIIGLDS